MPWQKGAVAPARSRHTLSELRRLARAARRRPARIGEAAPLHRATHRQLSHRWVSNSAPAAWRFASRPATPPAPASFTCVLHDADAGTQLTASERAVAEQLCDGRTLAQIARLRGVTINTVKSQVRQIFRKLDVDTRVALVRRLCP